VNVCKREKGREKTRKKKSSNKYDIEIESMRARTRAIENNMREKVRAKSKND